MVYSSVLLPATSGEVSTDFCQPEKCFDGALEMALFACGRIEYKELKNDR